MWVEGAVRSAEREDILVNVMQMMLASEAVDILLLHGKASIFCCVVDISFVRLNARRSLSPLFPAAENFITCLSSPLPVAPFCFVLSVLVKSCTCLFSNPIPCLLCMHSERVVRVKLRSVAVVSRQCVLFLPTPPFLQHKSVW